jgi:hypothetical protein
MVTVNSVTAAALQVRQDGNPPLCVINRDPQFAKSDSLLNAMILKGTSPVFVSTVQAEGSLSGICWQLDRDPSEGDLTPPPALSNRKGAKVSFQPGVSGNFRLIAYDDLNGNGSFDAGEQLFVMRFAIVQVSVIGIVNFRSGDEALLRTGLLDPPAAGMSLDARYLVEGGGADRTIGARKVTLGNVGNAVTDTFQVDYPRSRRDGRPGMAVSQPGKLPMLDTKRPPSPQDPGRAPFRSNSTAAEVAGSPSGVRIRVSSRDNPQFFWAARHPATGNPFGAITGSVGFREFIVAFSRSFPTTYLTLFQADWTATACVSERAKVQPLDPAQPAVVKPPFLNLALTYIPRPSMGAGPGPSGRCRGGRSAACSPDVLDFALGQVVANALGSGCEVFSGELLTGAPPPGKPARVLVNRPIVGTRRAGETVAIPYSTAGTSPGSPVMVLRAWDHVRFSPGARVMVLLVRHPIGTLLPSDPILVTSRQREFKIILSLIQWAGRLERTPEHMDAAVSAAMAAPDPALGGFLCGRIWHHESVRDPDLASRLLGRVLGQPAVPAEAWREIAQDLALSYALVSGSSQTSVFNRFLELAEVPDTRANEAAFHGIGKIASYTKLPQISPDLVSLLAKTYSRLVDGGMPPEPYLEGELLLK